MRPFPNPARNRSRSSHGIVLAALACAALFGCLEDDDRGAASREAQAPPAQIVVQDPVDRADTAVEPAPDAATSADTAGEGEGAEADASGQGQLRFEISVSERKLYVYRGDEVIRTHPVAVGQPDYPTPRGSYRIYRVDWNPDWTPPGGEWAEEYEHMEPGDPENPMGRARLVFKPPYTIHGTDALGSLGQAESHGSVRVANDVAMELARLVMEEGGASRPESWYDAARANPNDMRSVALPDPIPLTIRD